MPKHSACPRTRRAALQVECPLRVAPSTISGVLTKQGFSVWGRAPNPSGYQSVDTTAEARAGSEERTVAPDYSGRGKIAGYTVMYDRKGPQAGVAVIDTEDSRRTVARNDDPKWMAEMLADEWVGRRVEVNAGRWTTPQG